MFGNPDNQHIVEKKADKTFDPKTDEPVGKVCGIDSKGREVPYMGRKTGGEFVKQLTKDQVGIAVEGSSSQKRP